MPSLVGSDLTKLTVSKLPQNFDSEMVKQDERICIQSLSRGRNHRHAFLWMRH